jgi:hypothetical protein
MITWKGLRDNFVEMNRAKSSDDLIAVGKNRVFCKHFGWGKFIHFFTRGWNHSERVEAVLQNIRLSFDDRIRRIENQKYLYFNHLGRELRGERFSIKDKEKAEREILQFCLRMRPLMQDVICGRDAFYLNLLVDSQKELLMEWKEIFKVIRFFQRIKDLEITLKTPLPYLPFLKVATSQPIKARENDQIKNWLGLLTRSRNQKLTSFKGNVECKYSKVRFLHRLLRDLVTLFKDFNQDESKWPAVAVLEQYLQSLGSLEFTAPDNKHLEWARSLHPGSVVRANGVDYEIGEMLQREDEHPEIPIIFALKGHPDLNLIIDCNEAIGCQKDYQAELKHCGVKLFKPIAVEEKGRALIAESLPYALADIQWVSKGKKIDPAYDTLAANPIVELVKGLMKLPFTPGPLTRESFAFNYKGEMRATGLLVIGGKSWKKLEDFVHEMAHDSYENFYQPVYDYIMEQSGLSRHVKWIK